MTSSPAYIPAPDPGGWRARRERFAMRDGAYVARDAIVVGAVSLGADSSIWFGCVLRGDDAPIAIGARTNVQDLTVIHADPGVANEIGPDCTIGHRAVLHGASVGRGCLVGMGSILLSGCRIGEGSIVGAGALVKEGMVVPPRSLLVGLPARVVRSVTDEERAAIARSVAGYLEKARLYLP
ncbi:MAG TPA: gamma carbonic anhydrase family protein [Planctomycetota bacterium]|nr:gamma carbonic anhydrase family protein [Planctomycetota bacterium]